MFIRKRHYNVAIHSNRVCVLCDQMHNHTHVFFIIKLCVAKRSFNERHMAPHYTRYTTSIFASIRRRVVVAEWLRRWTRNPLGSSRAGSNPADNDGVLTRAQNPVNYPAAYTPISPLRLYCFSGTSQPRHQGSAKWPAYYLTLPSFLLFRAVSHLAYRL